MIAWRRRAAKAATLLAAMLAVGAAAPPARNVNDPGLEGFLDAAIAQQLRHYHLPGAAIAIVQDGVPILVKGYGFADLERRIPVDPTRTVFRAASISKTFNAVAVMQQVEAGKLRLDRDIGLYLDLPLHRFNQAPITLSHLLTHTSGLEEAYYGAELAGPADIVPLRDMLMRTLPRFVRAPGSAAAYSNHGIVLSGHIVERTSGMDYASYMQQNILAPLGMKHSSFAEPVPPAIAAGLAKGYNYDGRTYVPRPFMTTNIPPAGGLNTTATDMAHFMIAMLGGGRFGSAQILRSDTLAMMQACHYRAAPQTQCLAYGFLHMLLSGQPALVHAGDYEVFHANLVLVPSARLGFAVFYNGAAGAEARDELTQLLMARLYPQTDATPNSGPWQHTAADYEGHYLLNRRAESSWLKIAGSLLDSPVTADGPHRITRGGYSYRQVGDAVFRNEDPLYADEELVFKWRGGRVASLVNSQWTVFEAEKIPLWRSSLATAAAFVAFLIGWFAVLGWAIATRRARKHASTSVRALGVLLPLTGLAACTGPAVILGYLLSGSTIGFAPPPAIFAALAVCNLAVLLLALGVVAAGLGWRDPAWTWRGRSAAGLFLIATLPIAALFWRWNFIGLHF